jgi:hypothetical protein
MNLLADMLFDMATGLVVTPLDHDAGRHVSGMAHLVAMADGMTMRGMESSRATLHGDCRKGEGEYKNDPFHETNCFLRFHSLY